MYLGDSNAGNVLKCMLQIKKYFNSFPTTHILTG